MNTERVDALLKKIEAVCPDLINKILSIVYYPQPRFLLNDIKSFYKTRQSVQQIYTERYSHEPEEINHWIYNDLLLFYNEDSPTMVGFVDGYLEKIMRSTKYVGKKIERDISIRYIYFIEAYKSIESLINIYLSKLTPEERDNFLLNYHQ